MPSAQTQSELVNIKIEICRIVHLFCHNRGFSYVTSYMKPILQVIALATTMLVSTLHNFVWEIKQNVQRDSYSESCWCRDMLCAFYSFLLPCHTIYGNQAAGEIVHISVYSVVLTLYSEAQSRFCS